MRVRLHGMDRRGFLTAILFSPLLKAVPAPVDTYRMRRIKWLTQTPEGQAQLQRCALLMERKGVI
jgi:hypothetical protein